MGGCAAVTTLLADTNPDGRDILASLGGAKPLTVAICIKTRRVMVGELEAFWRAKGQEEVLGRDTTEHQERLLLLLGASG